MLEAKRQSARGLKEKIEKRQSGERKREEYDMREENPGERERERETTREGRASSTASSSALRRHLSETEGERTREKSRMSRQVCRRAGGRFVRENRVRDVTAKEEPWAWQQGGVQEEQPEKETQEISGNSLGGGGGGGGREERDQGNPSQRPKTGFLCSTKETSESQKEKRSLDPTTRSYIRL